MCDLGLGVNVKVKQECNFACGNRKSITVTLMFPNFLLDIRGLEKDVG
jgi:hypothetical protein